LTVNIITTLFPAVIPPGWVSVPGLDSLHMCVSNGTGSLSPSLMMMGNPQESSGITTKDLRMGNGCGHYGWDIQEYPCPDYPFVI
jgi:hypothetical protein